MRVNSSSQKLSQSSGFQAFHKAKSEADSLSYSSLFTLAPAFRFHISKFANSQYFLNVFTSK
ncbi:MAG: hypothetical protein LBC61_03910 [Candidatus Peribacteria bacterium]|nr:hypothetical protein [Candidatus Peribacteria bacterium]